MLVWAKMSETRGGPSVPYGTHLRSYMHVRMFARECASVCARACAEVRERASACACARLSACASMCECAAQGRARVHASV